MIFSVYHKNYPLPNSEFITPIIAGEDKSWNTFDCLEDSTGDNIAAYNKVFSELTSFYWVWKNYPQNDDELIGFSHYRRYFIREPNFFSLDKLRKLIVKKQSEVVVADLFTKKIVDKFEADLNTYQFILPYAEPLHLTDQRKILISIKDQYIYNHIKEDWFIMEACIKEMYPDYYESFNVVKEKKHMRNYNMFITRRKYFNDFCAWMFPLLMDIYSKVTVCEYPYQKRVISFMSERLFNLYIYHNQNLKVKNMAVLFIDADK